MGDTEKISFVKAIKSPITPLFWIKVIMFTLGAVALFFGWAYPVYKTYFQKEKPAQTTTIGSAGTVIQDCSCQVRDALLDWEKNNKKSKPWIELRLWKIMTIGMGGT